jgi:hypothetical protein
MSNLALNKLPNFFKRKTGMVKGFKSILNEV